LNYNKLLPICQPFRLTRKGAWHRICPKNFTQRRKGREE